jgi:hypothetical protein
MLLAHATTVIGASGLLAACADSTSPGHANGVSLSFVVPANHSSASIANATGSAGVAFATSATQSLSLTQVQLVVERAELGVHGAEDCEDDEDECEGGCDDHDAGCEEFTTGPLLIDLPLSGDLLSPVIAQVPAGTFDELEIKVGPPNHGDGNSAFLAAHPSWPPNASVHVTGTFDAGTGGGAVPFDVTFPVRGRFEIDFDPPLVIDALHSAGNVTLTIDVIAWFQSPTGGFLNPLLLPTNEGVRMQVVRNIKRSLRAFRDDDRNGHDDHDHG